MKLTLTSSLAALAMIAGSMVAFGDDDTHARDIVALKGLHVRPAPFVASFTAYFIALHVTEALYMRRLFAGELRGSR